MTARLLAALLLVAVALPSVPARADDAAALEEAVRLFRAADYAGAAPLLERLHAVDPTDLDTALLLGITYRKLGREAEAEPLLRAAAAAPEPQTRDSARTFLEVAASRRDAGPAPISLYLLLRPEWDSDVALASGALVEDGAPAADGALLTLGSVDACLGRALRLCLTDTLSYRRLARRTEYDTLANLAALAVRARAGGHTLALSYGFELTRIGGDPFALGHLGEARWSARLAGVTSLVSEAKLAWRDYTPAAVAPLSGLALSGLAGLRWSWRRLDLVLGGVPLRDEARDAALSAWGAGGRLEARLRLGGGVSTSLAAEVDRRWFDEGRRDLRTSVDGELVIELTRSLALVAGGSFWRNQSSDDGYVATRTTLHAGVDLSL